MERTEMSAGLRIKDCYVQREKNGEWEAIAWLEVPIVDAAYEGEFLRVRGEGADGYRVTRFFPCDEAGVPQRRTPFAELVVAWEEVEAPFQLAHRQHGDAVERRVDGKWEPFLTFPSSIAGYGVLPIGKIVVLIRRAPEVPEGNNLWAFDTSGRLLWRAAAPGTYHFEELSLGLDSIQVLDRTNDITCDIDPETGALVRVWPRAN